MSDEQRETLIAAEAALRACLGPDRYLSLELKPAGGTLHLLCDVTRAERVSGGGSWSVLTGRTIMDALWDAEENLAEAMARFEEDYE